MLYYYISVILFLYLGFKTINCTVLPLGISVLANDTKVDISWDCSNFKKEVSFIVLEISMFTKGKQCILESTRLPNGTSNYIYHSQSNDATELYAGLYTHIGETEYILVYEGKFSTFNSNLPVFYITTVGIKEIVSRTEFLEGSLNINNNKELIPLSIRTRGNATAVDYPKKPYKLKLQKKKSLLGMSSNKKWVLLAHYCDKTLIRDATGFEISKRLEMDYTPDYRYVDVVVNGQYMGNYVLTESVSRDPKRINIEETGFIIEIDGYYYREPYYFRSSLGFIYTHKYPAVKDLDDATKINVIEFINKMEATITNNNDYYSTSYEEYIDKTSAAKWFVCQETMANLDTNNFFYKKDNTSSTKLIFGPLWDVEWSIGSGLKSSIKPPNPNYWSQKANSYMRYLFYRESFVKEVIAVWEQYNPLFANITEFMVQTAKAIEVSRKCNFTKWPVLNKSVAIGGLSLGNYPTELECDIRFISEHYKWLQVAIPNLPSENNYIFDRTNYDIKPNQINNDYTPYDGYICIPIKPCPDSDSIGISQAILGVAIAFSILFVIAICFAIVYIIKYCKLLKMKNLKNNFSKQNIVQETINDRMESCKLL